MGFAGYARCGVMALAGPLPPSLRPGWCWTREDTRTSTHRGDRQPDLDHSLVVEHA